MIMNVVLITFFRKLPAVISLPVAIWGILGLLLALVLFWKKTDKFTYWFFFLALSFMLSWRLAMRIMSSRYGLFLVIPCTIGASYLCFHLRRFFELIPFCPEAFLKRIPLICMAIFLAINISRLAVQNTREAFLTVGQAVAKDITFLKENGGVTKPVGFCTEFTRFGQMRYYGKIPIARHPLFLRDMPPDARRDGILRLIKGHCHHGRVPRNDTLYFLVEEPSDTPVITASDLGVPEECWGLISSEYRNDRKKAVFRAYRYMPPNVVNKIRSGGK